MWINTCFSAANSCLFKRIHILHVIKIYNLIHIFILYVFRMLLLFCSRHYIIFLFYFMLFLLLILNVWTLDCYFFFYFNLVFTAVLPVFFEYGYVLFYNLKCISINNLHFHFIDDLALNDIVTLITYSYYAVTSFNFWFGISFFFARYFHHKYVCLILTTYLYHKSVFHYLKTIYLFDLILFCFEIQYFRRLLNFLYLLSL